MWRAAWCRDLRVVPYAKLHVFDDMLGPIRSDASTVLRGRPLSMTALEHKGHDGLRGRAA